MKSLKESLPKDWLSHITDTLKLHQTLTALIREVLPDELAQNTEVIAYRDKYLTLGSDNAGVAQQLHFMQLTLIAHCKAHGVPVERFRSTVLKNAPSMPYQQKKALKLSSESAKQLLKHPIENVSLSQKWSVLIHKLASLNKKPH